MRSEVLQWDSCLLRAQVARTLRSTSVGHFGLRGLAIHLDAGSHMGVNVSIPVARHTDERGEGCIKADSDRQLRRLFAPRGHSVDNIFDVKPPSPYPASGSTGGDPTTVYFNGILGSVRPFTSNDRAQKGGAIACSQAEKREPSRARGCPLRMPRRLSRGKNGAAGED